MLFVYIHFPSGIVFIVLSKESTYKSKDENNEMRTRFGAESKTSLYKFRMSCEIPQKPVASDV